MSGKHPSPYRFEGKWVVDLRPWGFASGHYVLGPDDLPELEAVHRAYAKLEALRAQRLAEPRAQLILPTGAPDTFAAALDEWQRGKRYETTAGKEAAESVAKMVRAELGTYRLAELDGLAGEPRLQAYVDSLDAKWAAGTVRWRVSVAMAVLSEAHRRRWIAMVPREPALPKRGQSKFEYVDEPTFRAIRAECFKGESGTLLRAARDRGMSLEEYVMRRRVGYSIGFYLGLHTRDIFGDEEPERGARPDDWTDGFTDANVSIDVGVYLRHNSKSAAHVPDEQFELPETLIDDLRELLSLLGREAFYCGERIAGGPLPHPTRPLQEAQKRLRIPGPPLTLRVLRKSYAREMFRRGYTVKEVADRMGQVSEKMLREFYAQMPRALGSARTRWTRTPVAGSPKTHVGQRVVAFQKFDPGPVGAG